MSEPRVRLRVRNVYSLVSRTVDEHLGYGVHHAFKHCETPSHDYIVSCCAQEVMNGLAELLDFDEADALVPTPRRTRARR